MLGDLAGQIVAPAEVFVVAQQALSPTPVTLEELGTDATSLPLALLTNPGAGLSAARNIVIERSRADVLVFMDDDARMPPEAIERITTAWVARPDHAALTFRVDWTGEGRRRAYPTQEIRRDGVRSLTSVASIEMAVSRRALRELNVRFDERFGLGAPFATGEELILLSDLLRRGGSIAFVPEVVAQHPARTSGSRLDEPMLRARSALFARIFGARGPAIAIAYTTRAAIRRELECGVWRALRASVGARRRLRHLA